MSVAASQLRPGAAALSCRAAVERAAVTPGLLVILGGGEEGVRVWGVWVTLVSGGRGGGGAEVGRGRVWGGSGRQRLVLTRGCEGEGR